MAVVVVLVVVLVVVVVVAVVAVVMVVLIVTVVMSGMSARINCDFDLPVAWWRSAVAARYVFFTIGLRSNYSRN